MAFSLASFLSLSSVQADTPLGWINSANMAAYTTTRGEFEISLAGLAVNDTIDFLNIRDELILNNRTLVGDSGNLKGGKFEIHYGVTEHLAVFYRRQQHSLTVDLGPIDSINLIDIDDALETTSQSAGFKWTFFQGNLLNANNRHSAASLELTAYSNKSDDFDVVLDEIQLGNSTITFLDQQTFSVAELEDEGWKARLVYTWPMQQRTIGSIWAGYGESEATSATTSDLTEQSIKKFFEQSFSLDESILYLGASIVVQITPRMPLMLSYEYVNIRDSRLEQIPDNPPSGLPGFLAAANQSEEDDNHTVNARISYWLTPQLNISLTANVYSHQFLGVLPHYNNPLSGSFSSLPYGFAGIELGYKF